MTSSETASARPLTEDPESDWAEKEFACWSPRDEPWFAIFTAAICLTMVVVSWLVTGTPWVPVLAAVGSIVASCRTWLPSVYRLGPLGVRHQLFRRWVLIPWTSVVRVRLRPTGVVIETISSQNPLVPRQVLFIHAGKTTTELAQLVQRFSGITPE